MLAKCKSSAARKIGTPIDRVPRDFSGSDLEKITSTYHAWKGHRLTQSRGAAEKEIDLSASASLREYSDVLGFCKSATLRDTLLPKLMGGELYVNGLNVLYHD
jgi:type I restriction-modification system DNA methylase subunit